MRFKKYLWGVLYSFILTVFTAYVLLDTFVITRVYTPMPSEENNINQNMPPDNISPSPNAPDNTNLQSAEITDTIYRDDSISITITTYREEHTNIYVADVLISSAEYLKTAFAQGSYGRNVTEKTSEISESSHAILAVNGDYYGARETGYVLRNGVLYRSSASGTQEDLVIYRNGDFSVITETEISAKQLLSDGAMQVLSFGPTLVSEGSITVSHNDEVGKAKASNPRTAIGIIDDLHYLFVVSDERTDESEGLSLYELAEFMQSLDAKIAYNLDGGGSSTMYFNGNVINRPTTSGRNIKERSVSDIVYIGY